VEIRQYESFKTIVEQKSFLKAARILGYAPSTITTHINGIEDELGGKVFDRIGKKIQITPLGQKLYQYSVELLNIYEETLHLSESNGEIKGKINIGAAESLILFKMTPLMRKYIKKFPEVDFSIVSDTYINLMDMLRNGLIDFGVLLAPKINDDEFIVETLSYNPLVFVANKETNLNYISNENIEQLNNETIILTNGNCLIRKHFLELINEHKINLKKTLEFSSIEIIRQCVLEGLGISLLAEISVIDLIKENKIKKIDHDLTLPSYEIQIVRHKKSGIHQQ
jgi:DNA-binding transcriptional LysR family regulator